MNPILNMPANTSDKAMAKDRTAITPQDEEYEGDNHPYRGTEAHGVAQPFVEWEEPDTITDPDEFQVPQYKMPRSQPVRVIDEGYYIRHRVLRYSLQTGTAKQVLGKDHNRLRFKIREVTTPTPTDVQIIMSTSGTNANSGFAIATNTTSGGGTSVYRESDWLQTQDELWLLNPSASVVAVVEIYIEYRSADLESIDA